MQIPSGISCEEVGTIRGEYYVCFWLNRSGKFSGIDRCLEFSCVPYCKECQS